MRGADAGLNMEARLDSPQQGQLGASAYGRDHVRQACKVKTHGDHFTRSQVSKTSPPFSVTFSSFFVFFLVMCPARGAGFASFDIYCSNY